MGSRGGNNTLTSVVSTYVTRARNSLYSINSTVAQGESIHLGNGSCAYHSNLTAKLSNGSLSRNSGSCRNHGDSRTSSLIIKSDEDEKQPMMKKDNTL